MDIVSFLESASVSLCGIATLLWMAIGTFARSEAGEIFAQRLIAGLCVISAIMLFTLHGLGGELWGSNYLPKPLSLICLILAFSARMNIKGTNISFGANPHNINKKDESDDSEE